MDVSATELFPQMTIGMDLSPKVALRAGHRAIASQFTSSITVTMNHYHRISFTEESLTEQDKYKTGYLYLL